MRGPLRPTDDPFPIAVYLSHPLHIFKVRSHATFDTRVSIADTSRGDIIVARSSHLHCHPGQFP